MSIQYYAHIRKNVNGSIEKQTLKEHCCNTAEIAEALLKPIGIGKAAYIAGYLHDMGKCKQEFQEYLEKAFNGEKVTKGSVVHTFAGVKYVLSTYHSSESEITRIIAEIIAYAIGAHHGLYDINADGKENGFDYRINASGISYEESRDSFFENCLSKESIDSLMKEAEEELWGTISGKILDLYNKEKEENADKEIAFHMGLLERLLLSSIIEGDRSDTAAFMTGKPYPLKKKVDWEKYLINMEKRLDAEGNYVKAEEVDENEAKTIFPVTEDSAGRSGTKPGPHPLCDQLGYYMPVNERKYTLYLEQLEDWASSEYSHPMLMPILSYIKKGTIVRDLSSDKIIKLNDNGMPKDEKAFIRWKVIGIGNEGGACWKNRDLQDAFSRYYLWKLRERRKDVCI